MPIQSAYQEEQERLSQTLQELDRQLALIGPRYFGDDYTEQVLDAQREERRQRLSALAAEPYFGRLDFQEAGAAEPIPLYIGKSGMEHRQSGKPFVIDWRAPVASLFYSFTGGDESVSYEAPDDTIEGTVHLKRSVSIRSRVLERVVDSYVRGGDNLGVTDEFLLYRLGENKDNRLRDIVSTIQAEQDRIIRAPKNIALVIQGVAGSGKTTVALHRLAYLLYRYPEQVRAERMIIFAPNAMFLDYISGVLPELGVGHIEQTTFADWALALLDREVRLADEEQLLAHWFAAGSDRPRIHDRVPGRYKGSLAFRDWLTACLDRYEETLLPSSDFSPWEGKTLASETVRDWFYNEYRHYPISQRRNRLVGRVKRWLEMELNALPAWMQKDRQKAAKTRLNAFLKKIPDDTPVTFYKSLFGIGKAAWDPNEDLLAQIPEPIVKWTQRRLKKGQVDVEDLSPLLWIRRRLRGIEGHPFDHVVIDEAQDFSPFQIALLREHMREPSFTILGDLAQGIHGYKGIHRWEEFTSQFAPEKVAFHQLRQSYRSTMEIIEFANRVLSRAGEGLLPALPVFRSGEPVELRPLAQESERLAFVRSWIQEARTGGAATMAVLCRTEEAAVRLHGDLEASGESAQLLRTGQTRYGGGLSVLPVYLAKGLEFDAVLVPDADAAMYPLSEQEAKLLYVGCTRALHRLAIAWADAPSPLIDNG